MLKKHGIEKLNIRYNEKSLAYIIRHYSKESGVRQLERALSKLFRKIAYNFLGNIADKDLEELYIQQNSQEENSKNIYQNYVQQNGSSVKYLLDKVTLEKFLGQ